MKFTAAGVRVFGLDGDTIVAKLLWNAIHFLN